jgi:mannosyl-oligosaccharide glucosidase
MKPQAERLVKSYGQQSPPDPAILFSLSNHVQPGAGMYGFQKVYSGKWKVDIFFESDEAPSGLDSAFSPSSLLSSTLHSPDRFLHSLFPFHRH